MADKTLEEIVISSRGRSFPFIKGIIFGMFLTVFGILLAGYLLGALTLEDIKSLGDSILEGFLYIGSLIVSGIMGLFDIVKELIGSLSSSGVDGD